MRARLIPPVAALVLLAGCGGKSPEPAPYKPSGSASSQPPPSSISQSADPKASAQAFVVSYFDAFAQASNSGDTSKLRAYGASDCGSCSQVIKAIEKTYRAGGHAHGVTYTLSKFMVEQSDAVIVVRATIALGPQTFASASAAPEQTIAPSKDHVTVRLKRSNSSWVIAEWTRE